MKHLTAIALIVAALAIAGASPIAEDGVPGKALLPTRAYNKALADAERVYEAQVRQARSVYVRELEKAKAQYMQEHDLAGATGVEALADEVRAGDNREDPTEFIRLIGDQVLVIDLHRDGSIGAQGGSTSWSRWSKSEGGIKINTGFELQAVDLAAYTAIDPRGNQVLLIEKVSPN